MKKESEVHLAIKQFPKEIGAPDSFVADMSGEQMSSEVKKFCHDIGTTLRGLEEGTPWSNKAELYIELIKEAVRKDMHELHLLNQTIFLYLHPRHNLVALPILS